MPEHITLPDNWQTHDELVKLLRNYDNDDTADADEMVAAFLAHHRSPAAPGCDCHLHVRQVCDTCQGVTGEEKDVEPASPRVPQPGDRVRVTYRKDGQHISSGRFVEEVVTEHGWYWGADDVACGAATVEVIEPAPADGYRHHNLSDCPDEQACPVHGLSPTVPDDLAREDTPAPAALDAMLDDIDPRLLDVIRDLGGTYGSLDVALAAATFTDTNILIHQLTHAEPEPHDEPAPATEQPYTVTPTHEALVTLMRDYATNDDADAYDMANEWLSTWTVRPADTGKETDR